MPIDWSRLDDAYGSAEELGPLFEEVGDPELEDDAWFELWERLYHQGSVYPASFAALPVLADIAIGRRPGEQARALALAGRIVAEEGQLHEPGHVRAHFPAALDELRQVMHRVLVEWSFEGDEDDHLYALETLMAFECVPVWNHRLVPDHHDVECPSCSAAVEIDLSGTGGRNPGSSLRDPYRARQGPVRTPVRPAAAADLGALPARLHRLAAEAREHAAARRVTHLFGRTRCPACAADLSVPERITAAVRDEARAVRRRSSAAGEEQHEPHVHDVRP
ncbi:hypothetical protein ACFZAU_29935 [Streptomyces sp. NPDC008238]